MLTAAEAAELLGVTHRHVTRLIRDGTLAAEHFGGAWAIREADVLRLVAARERNPPKCGYPKGIARQRHQGPKLVSGG